MNPSSLQTEIGWGCSLTNSTLHNGVGSLGCESSIFFFSQKKSILLVVLFMIQPEIKSNEIGKLN